MENTGNKYEKIMTSLEETWNLIKKLEGEVKNNE